jgi:hypothetical protein
MTEHHASADAPGADAATNATPGDTTNARAKRWAEDLEFVFQECLRLQQEIKADPKKWLRSASPHDAFAFLPAENGTSIHCGAAAYAKLRTIVREALQASPLSRRAEFDTAFTEFKKAIMRRFVTEGCAFVADEASDAAGEALDAAARECRDLTHFTPCRLMYATEPKTFAVGPVVFRTHATFEDAMAKRFTEYLASGEPGDSDWDAKHLAEARGYYAEFTWVAEVRVLGCAPRFSQERAELAVTSALNILHLMFGPYHSDNMAVGGPRMSKDRRAHLSLPDAGPLLVSTSSASTSAVGIKEGLPEFFARADVQAFLNAAAKTIEPIVDPSIDRPVAQRFSDAASWFGQAVRETSSAARIVKAVTAIERLVAPQVGEETGKRVRFRAVAVRYQSQQDKTLSELMRDISRYYDLRSDLVHGEISPFDPIVLEHADGCVRFAEKVIGAGLMLMDGHGLFETPLTNAELATGFDALSHQVFHDDRILRRAAKKEAAPSAKS